MSVAKQEKENLLSDFNKNKRMIGDYILIKTLGEGTFGKVKLAIHSLTQEKVAIKILEKQRIVEVADVERVQREIHILKLIRHRHVIQLYEIIETSKHIFLVMEFADGGELFEYIVQNQRLNEIEASKFFQELISGIEYLHQLQIVHRDLKPENLLLDFNKGIKIVDFGLSNTYKKGELLKTACGSPCYAAPEMIAGQRYNSLMVDIWSCGVILFASLCGYLPFEDQNTSALYKKILNGDYQIPSFISSDGNAFLKAILTTDPKKRISIEQMKTNNWFNLYKREVKIPSGIRIGYHRIPIDEDIIKQMEEKEFNPDYTRKCLDANKHNHVTTTYFLLLKRHLIAGNKSKADINCNDFDGTLIEPIQRPQKFQLATIGNLVNHSLLQIDKQQRSRSCQYTNGQPEQRRNSSTMIQNNNNLRGISVGDNELQKKGEFLQSQHKQYQKNVQLTNDTVSYQSIIKEETDSERNKNATANGNGLLYMPKKIQHLLQENNFEGLMNKTAKVKTNSPSTKVVNQIPINKKQQQQPKTNTFMTNQELFMQTMGGRNSKAPLYNKTSSNKNANNLSSDYGYLNEKRRPSQKNQKDLLDMTNYQIGKRNLNNLLLDNQENLINNIIKTGYPKSTQSNQVQMLQGKKESRTLDTSNYPISTKTAFGNTMHQRKQSFTKQEPKKNDRKSSLNQSFNLDKRGYLI